jgi:hypothetical protein
MSHKIGNEIIEDNSYTFVESNINTLNTKYKQTHTHTRITLKLNI